MPERCSGAIIHRNSVPVYMTGCLCFWHGQPVFLIKNFEMWNFILKICHIMNYKINSEGEYQQVMEKVEAYLEKATRGGGFQSLPPAEQDDLHHLSLLAEAWEDGIPLMPIRQPKTLTEMLELKMYDRKLKQNLLPALLGVSATRLSEVMQGKRKVNMDLAKRLYQKLKISPAFILEQA